MGRELAVCYTPDDDCENAIILATEPGVPPDPPDLISFSIRDWTFSPSRNAEQGRKYVALLEYEQPTTPLLAAAFCPADSRRYVFMPAGLPEEAVVWTRFASPYHDQSPPESVLYAPGYVESLSDILPATVVDIAAHFNGAELEVAILLADGTLQIFRGKPWLAATILYEVEYRPAQSPAVTRRIGQTDFALNSLGVYLKPDNAQHIIMAQRDWPYSTIGLYLSWGSPNLSKFEFGPFPNFSF